MFLSHWRSIIVKPLFWLLIVALVFGSVYGKKTVNYAKALLGGYTMGGGPASRGGQAHLQPPAVQASSLIAYYPLNGNANNTVGTTHNDLTDNNSTSQADGKIGKAASFASASSQYLSFADSADVSTGDIDFTLGAWVYLADKSATRAIVGKWNAGTSKKEYLLSYDSGADRFRFSVSTDGSAATTVDANTLGSPSATTWYYVVAWHDSVANTINIQVNNGAATSTAFSTGVRDDTAAFTIGAQADPTNYMNGRIDEVALWKRVLTASEKTTLYNSGSGTGYSNIPAPSLGNLISWWSLGESTGSRVDSNNHVLAASNGTANGSPTLLSAGKYGAAYTFSGTSQSYRVSALSTSLTADGTIAAWFKTSSSTSGMRILDAQQSAATGMQIRISAGQVCLDGSGGVTSSVCSAASTYNDGLWHHVAAKRVSTTYTFYLDGSSVGTSAGTAPTYTALRIGEQYSATNYFNGSIDDVRVYSTGLADADVSALYNPSNSAPNCDQSCVTWWKLDEGSGTTATDYSASGLNGTYTNSPGITSDSVFGLARTFNGTTNYITSASSSTFSPVQLTYQIWFKPTTIVSGGDTRRWLVSQRNNEGDNGHIGLLTSNTTVGGYLNISGTLYQAFSASGVISANNWYYLAMTYDGTTMRIYLNGVQVASTTVSVARSSIADSIRVGCRSDFATCTATYLDDFRIYNRALASYEIANIYAAGRPTN